MKELKKNRMKKKKKIMIKREGKLQKNMRN